MIARVQCPHGTTLIACHLLEHKPLVGSIMTLWHVTTDHQHLQCHTLQLHCGIQYLHQHW